MKILLFAGAGSSAELGVPAMRSMAEQFINHLRDLDLEDEVVEQVDRLIRVSDNDMEHAIDVIDRIEAGLVAQRELGEIIEDAEIAPYRTLREEAEWFVQHSREQVKLESAIRMWSPTLRVARGVTLTIATTNYDRAVEITAGRLRIALDDGFCAFAGNEIASWRGFSTTNSVRLLKLHGSTDWYHGAGHQIFKLRHPMPLYGPLEVVSKRAANLPLHSALVLPSREKRVTLPPFPDLSAEFRSRAVEADVAIFVGSSLRDPHILDVCRSCARDKPTFIVTRNGKFAEGILTERMSVIRQSSGQFLAISLPQFLESNDLEILVTMAASPVPTLSGLLEWIVIACTEEATIGDRCGAIEKLANLHLSLPKEEIQLLLNSGVSDVRLYALGLVQASSHRSELLKLARDIAQQDRDAEFAAELEMLGRIVAS